MHLLLHFGTFGLMVLQLILAPKLSKLEQFENFAANNQLRKQKREKMTPKSNFHCQAIKKVFVGRVMLPWQWNEISYFIMPAKNVNLSFYLVFHGVCIISLYFYFLVVVIFLTSMNSTLSISAMVHHTWSGVGLRE